jgi:RNA polymerase sigma-70 factor (ECF subfamily)
MGPPESSLDALRLHDRALRGLAQSLLSDVHAAEDVAQDAWLAALERRSPPASLPAWLTGVARHLAAKLRRGDERRARREQDSARSEAEPSAGEILEREAARARVVAAVFALEEPYRGTVLLRYFENLPPRTIARRHGVPVETVRTRLKRAHEALRGRLDGEFGERRAWALLLAPLARAPVGPLPPALEPLATTLALALMSTQAKLIGGVAVALVALVWFTGREGSPGSPAASKTVHEAPAVLEALPRASQAPLGAAAVPPERSAAPALPSEPPAPVPATGSLLVRVTWSDRTPAAGIRARVEPRWSSGNPSWRALTALTDEAGTFRLLELPPGRASVSFDRYEGGWIEIEAGEESVLEQAIERGFDVSVVVLDPLGSPVAGAEVWLSYAHDTDEGTVVGLTGAEGRFFLRSVGGGSISARAPGFAPALLQQLRASEGATLELDLVLMGPGGALSGRVLGATGEPVAGAWVAVEPPTFPRRIEAVPVGGTRRVVGLTPPPQTARTDAAGRYELAGLAPGPRRVVVRASGHAPWHGEVEVSEHGRAGLDAHLGLGVTVAGRVLEPDGSPADAEVRVGEHFGPLAFLLRTSTSSDAEGRFVLADLAPGELTVVAEARKTMAQATLRGAPGETLSWEVSLASGGTIRGRLVDERGAPLSRHSVETHDEGPWAADACGEVFVGRTDAEGRFAIEGPGQHPHRLEVEPLEGLPFPLAVAHDVFPDREELLLLVEARNRPSVRIVGTVLDATGAPLANAPLRATNRDFWPSGSGISDPEGRFELGPFPPGTYRLQLSAPSGLALPALTLGPRALAADEVWDCGALALEAGGELAVRLDPSSDALGLTPTLTVLRGTDWVTSLQPGEGSYRSVSLAPGAYRLALAGAGVAVALVPFELRPGQATELTVPLARGIEAHLRVELDFYGTPQRPLARVTDAAGTLLVEQELLASKDRGFALELGLPPGTYRVTASVPGGRTAESELHCEPGAPPEPLVLDLR